MLKNNKINLGCGTDIRDNFINVDKFPLNGIDVVHNLSKFPWPFNNGQFDEAIMINVLEHLPDTIAAIEELWRILEVGGKATIRVPYWNCRDAYIDPTHRKYFHQESLNFYDPSKYQCKKRPYLANARFTIKEITYFTRISKKWFRIRNSIIKSILGFFATYLNNIIWVIEFEIMKIENPVSFK